MSKKAEKEISGGPPSSSRQKKSASCPLCGQPRAKQWRPFCSPRCRDVDLFRWLNGGYVIAGQPASMERHASKELEYGQDTGESVDHDDE